MTAGTELVTELVAICTNEPRGDYGLEGYQRDGAYRCQLVEAKSTRHYRVFPGPDTDYYECAVPRTFTKFFRIEEKA